MYYNFTWTQGNQVDLYLDISISKELKCVLVLGLYLINFVVLVLDQADAGWIKVLLASPI